MRLKAAAIGVVLLACGLSALEAQAALLYLKGGRKIEGQIIVRKATVTVVAQERLFQFALKDVQRAEATKPDEWILSRGPEAFYSESSLEGESPLKLEAGSSLIEVARTDGSSQVATRAGLLWVASSSLAKEYLFATKQPLPVVRMETAKGPITLELFEDDAPNTVANFISLAERGFYDGLTFHRVEPGILIQGGDPKGDGTGGPGYRIRDEISSRRHLRGVISMAKTEEPDSAGSQFFITLRPLPSLDGRHTVFGRVTEGLEVAEAIEPGDAIVRVTILSKRDHPYEPETLPLEPK
jgi:peptidyl-prolyl cis-trans isomerase B (cyclophilin B)